MKAYLLSVTCYQETNNKVTRISGWTDLCISDTEEKAKSSILEKAQKVYAPRDGWIYGDVNLFPIEDDLITEIYEGIQKCKQTNFTLVET